MKIINGKPFATESVKNHTLGEITVKQRSALKNLLDLVPGDKFTAQVIDVKPGGIVLKLADGGELAAKSPVMPDAHIGDSAVFAVKENEGGQILLEMVKSDTKNVNLSIVKEALKNASLPLTDENADLVAMLIKENLPIDAKNLQKAAYFKYAELDLNGNITQKLTDDEILFFVKESFEPVEKTVLTYEALKSGSINMLNDIENILSEISKLDDGDFIAQIKEQTGLGDTSEPKTEVRRLVLELREKLFFDITNLEPGSKPKAANPKNVPPHEFVKEYFKEVQKIIGQIKQASKKWEIGDVISEKITHIADNLEWTSHVENYKQYIQLPYVINEQARQAELHILDKRGRKKTNPNSVTAVLSLDYENIGHVEVLVGKTSKNLALQFKCIDSARLDLFKTHMSELTEVLNEKGYNISSLSFKKSDERFEIIGNADTAQEKTDKRYSFDIRV